MKRVLITTFTPLALVLAAGAVSVRRVQAQTSAAAHRVHVAAGIIAPPKEDPADSMYRVARQLITSREYRRAERLLKQLVEQYPNAKPVGDALYWRAWSLFQLGRDGRNMSDLNDARVALDRYIRNYSKDEKGATDAHDLYQSIRAAQAALGDAAAASEVAQAADNLRQQRGGCGSADDQEMRAAALDGLLGMRSEDAVPILKDVLKQRDECRAPLRKKAVFLLSQKQASDIATTLLDVARNDPSNDVRSDAIFWLSQTRAEAAIPALDSIVFQSRDEEVRKKAVFALGQQLRDARARSALQRAAENESLPEDVRNDAIFWLGQSSVVDLDFFKQLFRKTKDTEVRNKIIFAVSQHASAEATAWLLDIARDKSYDTDVRKQALFWLGQRRSTTMDMLQSIYNESKGEEEMRAQVIFVYSQSHESAAVDKLMDIAKNDPSLEMRKKALFWLGQKNDPRVRQFLMDLIRK